MFNKYIFNYLKIWIFFNEGEINYKITVYLQQQNYKAILSYKMERRYVKNKEKKKCNLFICRQNCRVFPNINGHPRVS